jgi:hypothetical protein
MEWFYSIQNTKFVTVSNYYKKFIQCSLFFNLSKHVNELKQFFQVGLQQGHQCFRTCRLDDVHADRICLGSTGNGKNVHFRSRGLDQGSKHCRIFSQGIFNSYLIYFYEFEEFFKMENAKSAVIKYILK